MQRVPEPELMEGMAQAEAYSAPAQRLRFERACLPAPQLAGGWSAVISNSLLHHLHDPSVLWRSIHQLAGPGACIYCKDLRRPESPAAAEALRARHLEEAGLADQLQVAPVQDRYLEVWGRLF